MITDPAIIAELKHIAAANGGCLRPEDVVAAAKSKSSPLHSSFDWDVGEAAEKWWLHQARNLIRVTVTFLNGAEETPMRVFVSLTSDRAAGNGYRSIVAVMHNANRRAELLQDAPEEMQRFQAKYAALQELAEVFTAMKNVKLKAA